MGPESTKRALSILTPNLNLPSYPVVTRQKGGRPEIYDQARKIYVALTPEEWVRQHFVNYLATKRGVPWGLVAIETGFRYRGMQRRADVVVYDRRGVPALMVECKATDCRIVQSTFDQIARYNTVVGARYLVVTNGLEHYCYSSIDDAGFKFHDGVPDFETMNDSRSYSAASSPTSPDN